MLTLAPARLTVPAVVGRRLSEGLGRIAEPQDMHLFLIGLETPAPTRG